MVHLRYNRKNLVHAIFKYILCYGSSGQSEPTGYGSLFKYILCYGSSKARRENLAMAQNLNTSYVMVHLGSGLRL